MGAGRKNGGDLGRYQTAASFGQRRRPAETDRLYRLSSVRVSIAPDYFRFRLRAATPPRASSVIVAGSGTA